MLAAVVTLEAANVSKQQAESLLRKVSLIEAQASRVRPGAPAQRTTLSENEVNSWFTYHAHEHLPAGVTRPRLTLVGNRKVIGTATVDLDAVAKSRASGGTFDVWNLVGGRVPVTVTGLLHAQGGRARFELQQADVSGVPVPRWMVEEMVTHYSRTPDRPKGVRLDQAFELPAGIRQIDIAPGSAIVVQ